MADDVPLVGISHEDLEIGKIYTTFVSDPWYKINHGTFQVVRKATLEEYRACLESYGIDPDDLKIPIPQDINFYVILMD